MKASQQTRNLWPYGIMAAFAIFISGTIGLIVLACSHRTDLVSADYYQQEIKFQNRLDQLRRTKEFNATGVIAYDAAKQQIKISLPAEQLRQAVSGRIQLYRPSAAALDQQMALAPDSAGVQIVEVKDLRPGLWKVRVAWTVGESDYFIDQKLVVGSANAPAPRARVKTQI
jgi:nitrogen fixation protein FixH